MEVAEKPKEPKIPTIKCHGITSWVPLAEKLTAALVVPPRCSLTGQNSANIVCSSVRDFLAAKKILTEAGLEYNTYQLPQDRRPEYCLRNIFNNVPAPAIQQALEREGFRVFSVSQLSTTRPTKADRDRGLTTAPKKRLTPVYHVILENVPQPSNILNLEYLLAVRVKITNFTKSKSVLQCHKCQGFGHSKNYCNIRPRCVKCAGSHETTECQKTDRLARCVNCGGDHPANYRGCPAYKWEQKRKEARDAKQSQGSARGKSFVDAPKPSFNAWTGPTKDLPTPNSTDTFPALPASRPGPAGVTFSSTPSSSSSPTATPASQPNKESLMDYFLSIFDQLSLLSTVKEKKLFLLRQVCALLEEDNGN
jgi:hypothetical protein